MPPRKISHKRAAARQGVKIVSIKYPAPDASLPYVNNFVITHNDHEFVLTFAQVNAPVLLNPAEVAKMDHVDASIVARFVMAPGRVHEVIDAITDNYRKWAASNTSEDSVNAT